MVKVAVKSISMNQTLFVFFKVWFEALTNLYKRNRFGRIFIILNCLFCKKYDNIGYAKFFVLFYSSIDLSDIYIFFFIKMIK